MADGVEHNQRTDNRASHPFAVDEEAPRSAFTAVPRGSGTSRTYHNKTPRHSQPTETAAGSSVDCFVDGNNISSEITHDVTGRKDTLSAAPSGRHEVAGTSHNNAPRTRKPSSRNAFAETPITKPIETVQIKGDAIGPGVFLEGVEYNPQYQRCHVPLNSRDDCVNGILRNRGNRRQDIPGSRPCSSYPISDDSLEHSHSRGVSNSAVTSRRNDAMASRHRLATDVELLSRPSWCDAKFAYNQILQGKATGNKRAVGLRSLMHRFLFFLGCLIQRRAGVVLIPSLILLTACAVGLKNLELETRVEKLWVESGGVLERELEYSRNSLGEGKGTSSLLLIQVGNDTASVPSLQLHLQAALAATKVTVTAYESDWGLPDICSKDIPDLGEIDGVLESIKDVVFPCLIISPLDCFYDGAELLGPDTPILIPYLEEKVQWKTLDPIGLTERLAAMEAKSTLLSLVKFREIIESAGVGHGYQDRWCLNPNSSDCPVLAPNKDTKQAPDVKSVFKKGCSGYATEYMKWPNDLLIGGVQKRSDGTITRVQGLQTIFHLMAPVNMYEFHDKTNKVDKHWSLDRAKNVLNMWQRKFVQEMYKVKINGSLFEGTPDEIHAFTETTAEDLILEFSNFSIMRVAGGYLLMLVYACLTMLRCKASRSQGAIGMAGVLLVALSVMAGLGMCSVLGIAFNAATTQVLPFLMLGLGVDDIFLIAHQFGEIACLNFIAFEERTGECLKRVGVSVFITSLAIISGFLFSMIIPMPALRSFAMQAAIVTCFNLFCVLIVFPAVLSLDLQRRKNNKLDIFCCFQSSSANDVVALNDYVNDAPRRLPDVRFTRAPEAAHHPQMESGTTFTMHQTIQAFSNDSFVTYLGPRTDGAYAPNGVTVNVISPENAPAHFQRPFSPPPSYTPGSAPFTPTVPEPPSAPKVAFQEPTEHIRTMQTSRQQSQHIKSTECPPIKHSRSSHRNTTSNLVTPMESVRSSTHSLVPARNRKKRKWFCWNDKDSEYSQRLPFFTLSAFAKKYYGPFLMKKAVKITVLVLCGLLLGGSFYGCVTVRDGLDFVDIFPRDTREHAAVSAQSKYFSFYQMYLISKEFDYAHKQQELLMLHQEISNLRQVMKNADGTPTKFWMELMRDWLLDLMDAFDEDWTLGHINETTWKPSASDNGKLAFKLLLQTGKKEDTHDFGRIGCAPPNSKPCPKVNIVRLVSKEGIIREDGFYNYLTAWSQHDPLAYMASQAQIVPTPATWDAEDGGNLIIARSSQITYAQMSYYLNDLRENEDFVEAINSVRDLCYRYAEQGVLTYPSGYPFLFWQQYIDLRQWLFVALGAGIVAISAFVSLVLFNLWAGGITGLFLLIISTEMLGFMGIVGIKLSAVPAVILVSVVGLGVEFTVHITLAFITSCGSREDRVQSALAHMLGPVIDGAVSTFLGVVVLSGSEFDFIISYFFQVLAVVVLLGLWNGIVVLPVVLSLIGPPPEVQPRGGGSRLKTPTPPPTPPAEEEETVCPNCNNCNNGRFSAQHNHPYARYSSRDEASYAPRPPSRDGYYLRGPYYPPYGYPHRMHRTADPRLQCQVNPGYSHPPSNGNSGCSTPRTALNDGRVYICQPDVVLYAQRHPGQIHAQHCDSSRESPADARYTNNRKDHNLVLGDESAGPSNHPSQPIATVTSSITLKVVHPRHQQYPPHLATPVYAGNSATSTNSAGADMKFQPILESDIYDPRRVPSYSETFRDDYHRRTFDPTRISTSTDEPSEAVDSALSQLGSDDVIA